ncbi:MARCHF2, partial [Symbiodinium sp. KB8]
MDKACFSIVYRFYSFAHECVETDGAKHNSRLLQVLPGTPQHEAFETPQCRFCLEEGSAEDFIIPCKCEGTSRFVHESCLRRWQSEALSYEHALICQVCRTNFSIKPPEKIWRTAARSRSASEDTAAALFDNVRTNPRYDREAIARIPRALRSRLRLLLDSGCLVLQTPARARDEAARRGRHNGDNFFVLFEAVVASRLAHWHKGIYLLAAKWERLGSDGSDALVGVNLAGQRAVPRHSAEVRQLQAQLPGKPVQCIVGGP